MAFRVAARGEAMFRFAAAANPCTRRFGCAADFNGVHESFPKKAVDKMDPSETTGRRAPQRPTEQPEPQRACRGSSSPPEARNANLASAGNDFDPVLFMIEARWFSTVR